MIPRAAFDDTLVRLAFTASLLICAAPRPTEFFVLPGGSGDGTPSAPFGRIQDAIDAARPGQVIQVAAGTYDERLRTTRAGTAAQPITLRAAGPRGSVLVTARGRVLTVAHPHLVLEGFILDGQYGEDDIIRIQSSGGGFTLRNSEVRRTSRDAIDMGSPEDVLIEGSLIHHALNAAKGRTDAHGIVAGAARRLMIRDTEVHTFSGDAFQIDPGRSSAGWSDIVIDGCRFWLAPLDEPANGFPVGTVPGENAVDTKAPATAPRATLTIRNTEAFGFRDGLITNMAAFNLKEHIDAVIDGVTVFDSQIAFRLRGSRRGPGARIRLQNAVIHSTAVAVRFEDNLESPSIFNVSLGAGVARPFLRASAERTVPDIRNLLLLGRRLPREARDGSSLAVPPSAFVDAGQHDYRLRAESPAVDTGEAIGSVVQDRDGTRRPQGPAYDVGAYEWSPTSPVRGPRSK